MSPFVRLNARLEFAGASLDTVTWRELADFLDAFIAALGSMSGAVREGMVPVQVTKGSLRPVVRMRRENLGPVDRLRRGPNRNWSEQERRGTRGLYEYLDGRSATLHVGQRKLLPVVRPPAVPAWLTTEHTTLLGEVWETGGEKGSVTLRFDVDGQVRCKVGQPVAADLAGHLYRWVYVTGVARRRPDSTLETFDVQSWRPGPRKTREGREAALRDLQAMIAEDLPDFDPVKALKDVR